MVKTNYVVTVSREVSMETYIRVSASSPEEAEAKVKENIFEVLTNVEDWHESDQPADEPSIDEVVKEKDWNGCAGGEEGEPLNLEDLEEEK